MCTGPRPFIPVANTCRVQMVYDWAGQRVENVFNVKSALGADIATLDRIQAIFAAWYAADLRAHQSPNATLVLYVLDMLSTSTSAHKEYTTSTAGTGANATLTTNATAAVKWSTGVRGRSFRGRTFHIGLTADKLQTAAMLTAAGGAALQAAYNALLVRFAAATPADRLTIVSYCTNGAWRAAGVATNVVSCSVDLAVDSQRRRLAGRGL